MKEQLLVNLIHSSSEFCVVTDAKRNIQLVNPTILSRTGFREDELLGKKDTTLIRKEYRAAYTTSVFKQLAEEGVWVGKIFFITKNQETIELNAIVRAIYDKNDKFEGCIIIGHDVREDKIAEQLSWKSETQLQQIFNAMKDAVLLLDLKGKIIMTNDAFCRMFGCEHDECLGMQMSNSWVDASAHRHLNQALEIVEREGTLSNFHLTGKKKDTTRIILSCSFSQLKKSDGILTGYVVSLRDVTNVHYSDELSKTNERVDRLTSEVHRKTAMVEVLKGIHRLV